MEDQGVAEAVLSRVTANLGSGIECSPGRATLTTGACMVQCRRMMQRVLFARNVA